MTFWFDRTCHWPMLSIGTKDLTPAVYMRGRPVPGFAYTADITEPATQFFLWLDGLSPMKTVRACVPATLI